MNLDQTPWIQTLITIRNTYYKRTMYKASGEFNKFWQPTEYGGRKDGKFTVICESEDQRDWLEDRGKAIAEKTLVGVLGEQVEVEFVCGGAKR